MRIEMAGLCFTSESGLPFSHDPWLVALSFVIAAFGSYAALDMADRARRSTSHTVLWRACAAGALGGGVWAMHFIGMLALIIDAPIAYQTFKTLLSLAIAVGFVALGLHLVRRMASSAGAIVAGGIVVGIGVAAMHYIGRAAMVLPGRVAYQPGLWLLSILVAMPAAIVALWLSTRMHGSGERIAAALVMAVAIGGTHYTGMAALVIEFDPLSPPLSGMANGPLVAVVAVVTIGLLLLALVSAAADRRLSAAAEHEAASLRIANLELQAVQFQLEATQREIIRRLCSAGEFRDNDTGQHVARMAHLVHRLALSAGCGEEFAARLLEAAPLHDIGKIGIPDHVLLKPGRLDEREWAIMRQHATIGHRLLSGSGLPMLDLAAEIAGSHHEKWDGSGYPAGLSGDAIPLSGRIVAVADVFDALLSPRPYKQPWPLPRIVAHLREQAGRQFDPHLVAVFLDDLDAMLAIRARFVDGRDYAL
ncbi:MHYT domain-containing protein [Azospirillum canadense]|uniref:MHYT domain-containing protein n=1 Tax=Azospirillum canadense TaxID=403962 RepID=UPI002226DF9B|nr:MHYT domain-containing protein [Azospirillum canadense]MCW2241917.1 response regulator RpfG family c-di-GMP phosphodiesterase [Azospirillum canadense]